MNVLLIAIDTLRADHLGCYGYPRLTSPRIDRLAAQGVRFANFFSPHIPTHPSFTTPHTGVDAMRHQVVSHAGTIELDASIPTLAELLKERGYFTASVDNDLIADPREQRSLADERPDVVAELSARLEEWVARRRAETGKPDPVDLQRPTLHRIGEMKTAVPADPKLVVRQGGGVGDAPTNSFLQRRVEGEANPRDKVDGALDRKLYAEGGRAD